MREKSKSRMRPLVPIIILAVVLSGGSLFAYQWLKPIGPVATFVNGLRQDANRVSKKIAADSRLRQGVKFNDFLVDIVFPMMDLENQTLIAPRIEFEGDDATISELVFTVYHDANGNFTADDDEPVMKWNASNISAEKGQVFTLQDRPLSKEMLDAVSAGGDSRFSSQFTKSDGGRIESHEKVQVKVN